MKRGDVVNTAVPFYLRLIPMRSYDGAWCFVPHKVTIMGYRMDMLAWETIADNGRIWYFTDARLK